MKLAMLWIGHVRTFHRVYPKLTLENLFEPLGVDTEDVDHFFFTSPAAQCRRNRANDPPADYSAEDAIEYVRHAMSPVTLEIRDPSEAAKQAVLSVRQNRNEQGSDWVNLEALTHQYVRRDESWKLFVDLEPTWRDYDVIIFNRPDVLLYDRIVAPSLPLSDDEIHVFTSLGPQKDVTGMDDRWAMGSPLAMSRYMQIADSVVHQYAVEKRPWCPEELNRRHTEQVGLRIVKCVYQGPGWPSWAPAWDANHVGIARFQPDDGSTLREALRNIRV
jgi:hypothetical protein